MFSNIRRTWRELRGDRHREGNQGGFAHWSFDREADGRVIAEAHVACYGVDATDAAAQCVKHLLVDVAGGVAEHEP